MEVVAEILYIEAVETLLNLFKVNDEDYFYNHSFRMIKYLL